MLATLAIVYVESTPKLCKLVGESNVVGCFWTGCGWNSRPKEGLEFANNSAAVNTATKLQLGVIKLVGQYDQETNTVRKFY